MINCTFENGDKALLRHAVVDILVIQNNQILLIKRAEHLSNGGKWALPGGFVDRDETCQQAAKRELKEETNLNAKELELYKIIDHPNRKGEDRQNIVFVYSANVEGDPKRQESEVSEIKWTDLDKLPKVDDFAFDHLEIIQEYLKSKVRKY